MRVQETAPSCGEMSEWLKEPVLKTGGAQVPVGSNPTLSANFSKVNQDLRKYPSGRRGSPAKGVGWIKPARGFKSLLPRQLRNSPYRSVSRPQGGKLRRTGNSFAFSREPLRWVRGGLFGGRRIASLAAFIIHAVEKESKIFYTCFNDIWNIKNIT